MRRLDNELQCLDWTIAVLAGVSYTASLLPLHHYTQLDVIRYQSLQLGESMSFDAVKGLGHYSPNDNGLFISDAFAVYIETDWQFIYSNILSSRNRFFGRISKR